MKLSRPRGAALVSGLFLFGVHGASAQLVDGGVAIDDVRYDVTFDTETAASRSIGVEMTFTVAAPGPVILSLPKWTPGAYEISDFAKKVSSFDVTAAGTPVQWDKIDYDTWRVFATAAGEIENPAPRAPKRSLKQVVEPWRRRRGESRREARTSRRSPARQ